jgi:A/G-specific adenine glycosylase
MPTKSTAILNFRRSVRAFHKAHRRNFPWRDTKDPYRILVSEFMLQQTQTGRVILKYKEFLRAFPTWRVLASAEPADVLLRWQGLGYNRRALHLKRIAELVTDRYNGKLPRDQASLLALPGIGQSTAGAVLAFAFGVAVSFIETNIRRTYIHFFFPQRSVSDKELLPLIEATLDRADPREWYYALMDYGAYLAKKVQNPNRRSTSYKKQTRFEGSRRQMRGKLLRTLLLHKKASLAMLSRKFPENIPLLEEALEALTCEGFLSKNGKSYEFAPGKGDMV